MNCTKAIIPVAGYGTRRLPITKVIEKCMLPLLNRPIIDYVVDDCRRAGITDIYFVISDGATQLRNYYERNVRLEEYLQQTGKEKYLADIMPPQDVQFHYIEQDQQDQRYGTTVPVWLASNYIKEDEQVLVIMGDQCLYRSDGGSEAIDLINAVEDDSATCGMIGVPVAPEEVNKYGIIESNDSGHFVRIVEKPSIDEAPSNLNNASFYLFDNELINYVKRDMQKPHNGEYMITDAINAYVAANNSMKVIESQGKYLDCGSVEGWVAANSYLLSQ